MSPILTTFAVYLHYHTYHIIMEHLHSGLSRLSYSKLLQSSSNNISNCCSSQSCIFRNLWKYQWYLWNSRGRLLAFLSHGAFVSRYWRLPVSNCLGTVTTLFPIVHQNEDLTIVSQEKREYYFSYFSLVKLFTGSQGSFKQFLVQRLLKGVLES